MSESPITVTAAEELVRAKFQHLSMTLDDLIVREYPDETVFIVHVPAATLERAAIVGNTLDMELQSRGFRGFVTIRQSPSTEVAAAPFRARSGITDDRAAQLMALVSSRSRTSETQPSLHYVVDAAANLQRVLARKHTLVFGRRGAGKTALLLEAKRQLTAEGEVQVWLNLQTYRREPVERIALWVMSRLFEVIAVTVNRDGSATGLATVVASLQGTFAEALGSQHITSTEIERLIPRAQQTIKRFTDSTGRRVDIFLDDFHYVSRSKQPELLDVLHSCVRDSDAWLKVAAIRHFSNPYRVNPPTGLQAGQDADKIDLDITLQEPRRAKVFLEKVLSSYAAHLGIPNIGALFAPDALDRLVLASGAVPRDYLVLAGASVRHARTRERAKKVGTQDVSRAAGDIAQAKIAELEDDAASASGTSRALLEALRRVREFCLDEKRYAFFQIDFNDRDSLTNEYELVQSLMDVRLIHILNPSVSDAHRSGARSEAYMLDLSQFSGERFKKFIRVLELTAGDLVLKETGTTQPERKGDTPRRLITILRSAPLLSLEAFSDVLAAEQVDQ